jgi:hypothetical protein
MYVLRMWHLHLFSFSLCIFENLLLLFWMIHSVEVKNFFFFVACLLRFSFESEQNCTQKSRKIFTIASTGGRGTRNEGEDEERGTKMRDAERKRGRGRGVMNEDESEDEVRGAEARTSNEEWRWGRGTRNEARNEDEDGQWRRQRGTKTRTRNEERRAMTGNEERRWGRGIVDWRTGGLAHWHTQMALRHRFVGEESVSNICVVFCVCVWMWVRVMFRVRMRVCVRVCVRGLVSGSVC